MKVVAIIQARMGSGRLPGKVLLELAGEPMLSRVVSRVRRAEKVEDVVVATTTLDPDGIIEQLCAQHRWPCFRGSEDDVLDRYYRAALAYSADAVVRITSDCPLIDPAIVDQVVQAFVDRQPGLDYAANTLPPRTFPRGLDIEVVRFEALECAWREDRNPAWREHVTPYLYQTPDQFRVHAVTNPVDYSAMRWTVDTPQDLAFVRRLYEHFHHDRFSWREALAVLVAHPEWLDINRHIAQKVI